MVIVDECRGALSNCPNLLIPTPEWKIAITDWVREQGVSERLRQRVKGDTILHHHKLRISISGCPNSCSRPQIADVGLVGFVRPAVTPEDCVTCSACEAACPDAAISVDGAPPVFDLTACQGCQRCCNACPVSCITLSHHGVRVLLGGKLGRHPRLAKIAGEDSEPSEVIERLDRIVDRYLASATPEERIADFLFRTCLA